MATARCTWTAVSGVDGYNVYLKSNGTFVKQNSELITETVYDIENLEDGNYEAYATSVLNSVESDASNVKGFEVASLPTASTDFSAYADTAAMKTEWEGYAVDGSTPNEYNLWDNTDLGAAQLPDSIYGGKALAQWSDNNSGNQLFVHFNRSPENLESFQVLMLVSRKGSNLIHPIHKFVDLNNYNGRTMVSTSTRAYRYTNGSFFWSDSSTSITFDESKWYWVRISYKKADGIEYIKIWEYGDTEPGSYTAGALLYHDGPSPFLLRFGGNANYLLSAIDYIAIRDLDEDGTDIPVPSP